MTPPLPSRERGSVLVEFALAVPILLVIFAGIVDFSLMMQRREVVTNAAREGARIAVLPGYGHADVEARVNAYLSAGLTAGATATVPPIERVAIPMPSGPDVEAVKITVEFTSGYTILGPLMGLIGGSDFGAITIRAQSTMRLEVPEP